jgi:hypothetical protein
MNECRESKKSTTESTIDNQIKNGLSTGVVRVKDAAIAVNNRITRVRNLQIAGGTRRNNKKKKGIWIMKTIRRVNICLVRRPEAGLY